MIELYHNAISTCSQKVRLVLAEKDLDFTSHVVDLIGGGQHDPEYVKLNPNHVVPTLVHDGRVLVESTLIIRYLDDAFPRPAMRSADAAERYAEEMWLKKVDDVIHPAAPVLTFAIGGRNAMLAQPEAAREANIEAIPDPKARAERRSVLEQGASAPEFEEALGVFLGMLDQMESELSERPWLSGASLGLADATLLPYVLRMEAMAMDRFLASTRRPNCSDWLSRWKGREVFDTAIDAWIPDVVAKLLRSNGEAVWKEVEAVAQRLGESG